MNRENNEAWLSRVSQNCEGLIPATQPNGEADFELTAHVTFRFTKGDGRGDPWGAPDDMHVCGVTLFGIPVDLPDAVLRKIEEGLL